VRKLQAGAPVQVNTQVNILQVGRPTR
jgi:hypothetical protein